MRNNPQIRFSSQTVAALIGRLNIAPAATAAISNAPNAIPAHYTKKEA